MMEKKKSFGSLNLGSSFHNLNCPPYSYRVPFRIVPHDICWLKDLQCANLLSRNYISYFFWAIRCFLSIKFGLTFELLFYCNLNLLENFLKLAEN